MAETEAYLSRHGDGGSLDFVHRCCLVRCWAGLQAAGGEFPARLVPPLTANIQQFRSADGGWHPVKSSKHGTAYGTFLGAGAMMDLRAGPDSFNIARSLKFLETPDGAWANERGLPGGATNATAAATAVLRNLGMPVNPQVGDWLLRQAHPEGGFRAAPGAPIPDLLSTATALHALAGLQRDFSPVSEKCLDFIDTLWTNEGAFHGHWGEDFLDTEYTYYGLLALGHLATV